MDEELPDRARKGRGAVSNAASARFPQQDRAFVDDGWGSGEEAAHDPSNTVVGRDASRTAITYNQSPDVPFDRSINPYKGCEHGCVYCFARPTHAYLDLSPGLDFETKLFAKDALPELLRAELAKPSYTPATITLGANTDPYQPVERERRLTRACLEVLAEANHPLCIVTKSALVARDADILAPMAEKGLARVMLSITTRDRELARRLEPRATTPAKRFDAVRELREAGVPTGVLTAPMIPAITDHELEGLLASAAEAGADRAGYVLLRLPHEIADLFGEWLDTHFPDRKARVLNRVQAMRGGQLNDSQWGRRLRGEGEFAELLEKRFQLACTKHGLNRLRTELRTDRFTPPARDGRQMGLF